MIHKIFGLIQKNVKFLKEFKEFLYTDIRFNETIEED
jgi:hypothetical protein